VIRPSSRSFLFIVGLVCVSVTHLISADRGAQKAAQALREPPAPSIAGITSASWTSIGPGNIGGRVRTLAVHPTVPTTIFAGGADGGIWRTTNGGTSWAPIDDFLPSLAITSIVFRPGDPLTMFAATGEGFYNADAVQGAGIYRSTNGGANWTQLPSTSSSPGPNSAADFQYVNRLAMSADGTVLIAGTRTGLFRSADLGNSWTRVFTPDSGSLPPELRAGRADIVDVKFLPGSSSNVVASGYSSNPYFSADGGFVWVPATGPTLRTDPALVRVELGITPAAPATVFMTVDAANGQVWRSVDAGHSYALVGTPAHLNVQGFYANALWVDPTNASIVVVGGLDMWRSTNGGTNWAKITSWQLAPPSVHGSQHAIVSDTGFNGTSNRRVYVTSDGGIVRTDDVYAAPVDIGGGLTSIGFTSLNHQLAVTQFYAAGGHTATGRVRGGTQGSGSVLYTPGGGPEAWISNAPGDDGQSAIDPTDPNYMYGEFSFARVHRASGGTTVTPFIYGSDQTPQGACTKAPQYTLTDACLGRANYIAPIVLDPNEPNRFLVGGWSLWRTNDARTPVTNTTGPTWAAIKAPTTGNSPISAIAVVTGDANTIWVGHNNGDLYVTHNGLAASPTWIRVDPNAPGLPDRMITSLTFSNSTSALYASFEGASSHNVWKTTNNGASWIDMSGVNVGALPPTTVRTIVDHPSTGNWLYAGTDLGLYASADNGGHWSGPQDGPARVAIYQLFWMGTTLVAATHGRGAFTAPVPAPTSTLTATPSALYFGATKDGPGGPLVAATPPQTVTVGYSGTVPTWTAISDQPWLQVTNGSGTGAGQFTVSVSNPGNIIGGAPQVTGTVSISATSGIAFSVPVTLNIQPVGTSAEAFGQVDAPAQNATGLVGAIGVSGWALDDIGLATVEVYRNCLPFENPAGCNSFGGPSVAFIGNAAFLAGARPDVEAAFPTSPGSYRAGWGLLVLTNMLPHVPNAQLFGGQGALQFYAYALDIDGHRTLLGRTMSDHTPTSVTLDNDHIAKPFGTIDTPGQGQTIGGGVANFGWALTPDTNTVPDGSDIVIPTNGSTMFAFIDGAPAGGVTFNQCRGNVGSPPPGGVYCNDDVANIFGNPTPQAPLTTRTSNPTRYRNLDAGRAAIGYFVFDTTTMTNGVHTIAWSVTDSASRVEGIGSRFFTVFNGAARPEAAATASLDAAPVTHGAESDLDALTPSARNVSVRTGFDQRGRFGRPDRTARGTRGVTIDALGRVEIDLAGSIDAAYLAANGTLRDLPIGSSLDRKSGRFAWAPPAGYLGTYHLVFVSGTERTDIEVHVR